MKVYLSVERSSTALNQQLKNSSAPTLHVKYAQYKPTIVVGEREI